MFDVYSRPNRFRVWRERATSGRGRVLKGTSKTCGRAARNSLEPGSLAQRCFAAGSRRDCVAGNPFFLQPPEISYRGCRYRGLARLGSTWPSQLQSISLAIGRDQLIAKLKIEGWRARWLIAFGYWLLQIWARTLRFKVVDRAGVVHQPVTNNFIGCLWHNRLLVLPYILKRFTPARHGAALISASRDGDLLTDAIQRFGFDVVRGSSSRMGSTALLQLSQVLAGGGDVVITPDGPRGPVYELGPGPVFLAQKTGAPVLPINLEYSSCWRFNSWDRFILPRPFSQVRVTFADPLRIPPTTTPEEFEAERLHLQECMMSLVERR